MMKIKEYEVTSPVNTYLEAAAKQLHKEENASGIAFYYYYYYLLLLLLLIRLSISASTLESNVRTVYFHILSKTHKV